MNQGCLITIKNHGWNSPEPQQLFLYNIPIILRSRGSVYIEPYITSFLDKINITFLYFELLNFYKQPNLMLSVKVASLAKITPTPPPNQNVTSNTSLVPYQKPYITPTPKQTNPDASYSRVIDIIGENTPRKMSDVTQKFKLDDFHD